MSLYIILIILTTLLMVTGAVYLTRKPETIKFFMIMIIMFIATETIILNLFAITKLTQL